MSHSNHDSYSSLPARPPPGARPNGPARSLHNATSRAPATSYMSSAPTYAPMTASQAPYNASGYQSSPYDANAYYQQPQQNYTNYAPAAPANSYQMQPPAAQSYGRQSGVDYEEEARIAEWNSAYVAKDDTAGNKKGHASTFTAKAEVAGADTNNGNPGAGSDTTKEKTVVRQGGGKKWEDVSLLEWDPSHPRLFVGNLAGEVTDDSLMKAFSKYPSVTKARVVRDKRSTKSKSYGFVSFSDTEDYFKAAREMEGKYIGSHPVRVTRANTEIVATNKKDDKRGKHGKGGKGGKGGQKGSTNANPNSTYVGLGPISNSGVHKHSKKNNGPRLLG